MPVTDDYGSTPSTAGHLSIGGSISGGIETLYDNDWFAVSLTAGTQYQFRITAASGSGLDPMLGISVGGQTYEGGSSILDYIPLLTGTYYLIAMSVGQNGIPTSTGNYVISATASSTGTDDYAANTSTTGRVTIGGSSTGNIGTVGDHDWFAVTLSAGQNYVFRLDAASSGGLGDPYLRICDSSGNVLASDDDGGGGRNSLIIATASSNGTYYLDAAAHSSETGNYVVSARPVLGGSSDIFISNASNNNFNGGAGDDAVVYNGAVNQYAVNRSGSSIIVTDSVSNRDGVDTLINIEHLQFTDRSINLTMQTEAAKVTPSQLNSLIELYVAYFNRVPEASGLAYWIDKVAAGETLTQVSQEFYAAGVQFSSITGYSANMSNAAFIGIVYANVLGRTGSTAPNAAEIAYWDGQISTGATTKEGLIQRMLSDAHSFANDLTWNWVTHLLDNKITVGNTHAVQLGVDYNTSTDAITQTVAIAHAVTPTDTTAAINLIGLSNVHLA